MKNVGSEATLQKAVDRLNAVRREIAKIIVGQDDVVEGVLICLLSGGHVLLEGVPGLGKTTLLRTLARTLHTEVFAHPVHAGPDARRHRGQHDHGERRARRQDAALPVRAHLRQPGAGRRNQPRHAQDAIRAARSDAGAHRHQRHHHARTGSALSGDGHAESHRNGRHLSAARSAARPLPDEDPGDLSDPRGVEPDRGTHHRARRRSSGAGDGPRRDSAGPLGVPRRSWWRRTCRSSPSNW